jgi:hypothetical protein
VIKIGEIFMALEDGGKQMGGWIWRNEEGGFFFGKVREGYGVPHVFRTL